MSTRSKRTEKIKAYILENVEEQPKDIASVTVLEFGVSRQSVSRHLRSLVEQGFLTATGQTKSREYHLKPIEQNMFRLDVTPELQEDEVWREEIAPLLKEAPENVTNICHYGFTEMLNNVIDHSEAMKVFISAIRNAWRVEIIVHDDGVGIFNKIQSALKLDYPRYALLELSKGKFTTAPDMHTGEGIFFTSRMFDQFSIISDTLGFSQRYDDEGWLIDMENPESTPGTLVVMKIRLNAAQTLQKVFDLYASGKEDYGFTRTHVAIKLAKYEGEDLVSRSQAKRIMSRVDRFEEVVLDFQDITLIGPSFADEIFRVFANMHPDVNLYPINTSPQVDQMVKRALASRP